MHQKENAKLSNESTQNKSGLWDWVKAISTLAVVGVFSYKVYVTPIALTVDFPTLCVLVEVEFWGKVAKPPQNGA